MAQNHSPPQRTSSSPAPRNERLEARREQARREMASSRPDEATARRLAKLLTGLWPAGKPDNPDAFLFGLGKVLEGFPVAVVEACCEPLAGLPRTREFFPTLKAVADWCHERVEFNELLIAAEKRRA